MAGGVMNSSAGGEKKEYPGRMTVFGFLACLVASSGGLIFGYDIGISGGVTSMDSFLQKFFPKVYLQQLHDTKTSQYCKFDSQMVTMFTSSLYLAALISSFFASSITRAFGRKWSMFSGGLTFLVGASINGGAQDIWMLIAGRILLGIGVGFTAQSVPLYVAEMAPMKVRGTLNIGFQLMITVGILCANVINYFTVKIKGGWGWRVSLAVATVPAVIITVGSLFLPDTPTSLIERGHAEKAKVMLQRIRGTDAIQVEYEDIVAACESSKAIKHPWSNLTKRKYRPQLTMAILIPFFQQITGINVVMFYAPVLFKTIGYGSDASLMSAVVTGGVNMVATFISIATVDRMGRRILFLEGGLQMLISQVAIGVLMQQKFGTSGQALSPLTKSYADILLLFIGVYTAAFAWSWGPLGWLVPSEIFPLQIRSACQAIVVSVNMLFTFVIAQAFLAALCHLKFGLFYAFAGWVVIMTVFVFFFLPETKNRPIEEMGVIWKKHWFWKKFVRDDDADASNMEMGKKSVE